MNKKEEWLSHVKQQKLSGKSIKLYCEEHGLMNGSWHYYKEKYLGKSKFVEATLVGEKTSYKCELVSKSGIRMIFEDLPEAEWLRKVLL